MLNKQNVWLITPQQYQSLIFYSSIFANNHLYIYLDQVKNKWFLAQIIILGPASENVVEIKHFLDLDLVAIISLNPQYKLAKFLEFYEFGRTNLKKFLNSYLILKFTQYIKNQKIDKNNCHPLLLTFF